MLDFIIYLYNRISLAKKRGVSSADVVRISLEQYHQALEKHEKALAEAQNVTA